MTTENDAPIRRRLIENELKLQRLKRTQSERMKWKRLAWKWKAIGALSRPQTYVAAATLVVFSVMLGFGAYAAYLELTKAREARWSEQIKQSRAAHDLWAYERRPAKPNTPAVLMSMALTRRFATRHLVFTARIPVRPPRIASRTASA